ncbi:DEAD/DEAH box helicase, partial [Psychrobacter sp. AOP7-D1-15]|uniref:DEAD/DEAH box helicase n=1 Tax=Psychrobacter sp. AOP7-D1-15 TaxID=3457637 RepID=UPI00402B303B
LCSDHFQKAIKDINLSSLMFIGDECHRHGANQTRSLLPDAAFKLGLSATPFNDDDDMLESPFGNDAMDNILSYYQAIVHEYSLEDAILDEVLTPYDYHIIPIHLTEVEQEEYDQLSESIRKIMINSGGNLSKDNREKMVTLTSKRSRLLGSAENKMFKLRDITSNISKEKRKLTLFYVGEGKDSEDNIIIDQVTKTLRYNDWKTAQFTGKTTKRERDELLHLFKQRRVDALIAMKVLDEGIDVPACSTAYILASTKNPRQYVQRRGRVLRKFPGKTKATIHDFVVLPCPYSKSIFGKKLYESELERVRDFSLLATNKIEIESHLQELEVLRV